MTNDVSASSLELKEIREGAKLRQSDMADRLGVSIRTYSRWETGAASLPEGIITRARAIAGSDLPKLNRSELGAAQGVDLGMEVIERMRRADELVLENLTLKAQLDAYIKKYGAL